MKLIAAIFVVALALRYGAAESSAAASAGVPSAIDARILSLFLDGNDAAEIVRQLWPERCYELPDHFRCRCRARRLAGLGLGWNAAVRLYEHRAVKAAHERAEADRR